MDTRRNVRVAKILCVELDLFVLESRCAVLKYSGYNAASASPQVAEILLRSQKFDLIVLSTVSDSDLHRIINLSDGAVVLVLDVRTVPS
jgi:DNA-binding response OmpR family regulator